ncbi:MAG: hypothetical protein OEZ68_03220 [Gammaproteobacteria bacterium]|nr:hypothetical protein [Gammaproteobacteria bacterium]MDH5799794.1 hypothetical protein [Gammaproteobacteria bacterium]
MRLSDSAKKLEHEWKEYDLPDFCIEKFVFENLIDLDICEYDLPTLLSSQAIQVVIKLGIEIINADSRGLKMVRIGHDKSEVVPSCADYETLFARWASAGWITVKKVNGLDISVELNI